MKSPCHPHPSGDRTLARLWLQALHQAGTAPYVASTLRTWDGQGCEKRQQALARQGEAEAQRILTAIGHGSLPRPLYWFTYHLYHKAPDSIGPQVSRALGIPYIVAEASVAPKQRQRRWHLGYQRSVEALQQAALVLTMNPLDAVEVDKVLLPHTQHRLVKPFLPMVPSPTTRRQGSIRQPVILVVAMMRCGAKTRSYCLLANALRRLPAASVKIVVAGDGENRRLIRKYLRTSRQPVFFKGETTGRALHTLYRKADIAVWPAVEEAIGMGLLEAQGYGVPVVAGETPGTASFIRHGCSGWLVPAVTTHRFAGGLRRALRQRRAWTAMGIAARRNVRHNHIFRAVTPFLNPQQWQ